MLVSSDPDLIEFARAFRNYGKFEHEVDGLNFRMSEFTAALALVQVERMEEIVAWKNEYARDPPRPPAPEPGRAPRRDDLGPLQVHRLRGDREEHRARLRGAVPPDHGPRRRVPQHRLGGAEPLVRSAVLPPLQP